MTGRAGTYRKVYELVGEIPVGRVATYGQIASMIDGCTARMVGYALAATPAEVDIPWQRVINSRGEVSPRADGDTDRQRRLLRDEGVAFDRAGRVDFGQFGWPGPDWRWLKERGYAQGLPAGIREPAAGNR